MREPPERRPVVWVVDDSPLDAARARLVLEPTCTVTVFADGSAMIEHLATHAAPDVLVLDWVMPGVSGIEVCRFVRAGIQPAPRMAVLLLTSQNQTEQIVEGLAAGANDYLVKPYADPELRARVDALVRWNGLLDRAQEAEARVLDLLEHSPDPFISVDQAGSIAYVNGEAQRALGQTSAELVGQQLAGILPGLSLPDVNQAPRHDRPLPDIEIGDQIFSPSVSILPTDAHSPLTVALRNVTARRRAETRRLDFYSIIAHDLRSPLGAMLMRTDLILRGRRGVLSAELIDDLRKMEGNMRSLVALINDFLDFAVMDESSHKMERSQVDLESLLRNTIEEFQPLIDSTNQRLGLQISGGPLLVMASGRRLQQVVTNLIANAIKFTPAHGQITVRGEIVDACWCEISVEDDGPGIEPDLLPTLFQRYTRAPSGSTRDAGGTGLGLLIVREVVEAHGGAVGVVSTPGQGSRFWFRLPSAASSPVRAGG
jgi:two-component system phosphate regulon sensor histidine kinase PhoR